jgi:hypothetical protein
MALRPKVGSSKIKYAGKAKVSALFHATPREQFSDKPFQKKRNVQNTTEYATKHTGRVK